MVIDHIHHRDDENEKKMRRDVSTEWTGSHTSHSGSRDPRHILDPGSSHGGSD
jgi:hypothetical protein